MARIVGTYKILPEDPETDLQELKTRIELALPEDMKITATGEQPMAFGLKALVLDINFDEQDGLQDLLEETLSNVEGISEFEALQLFRI
ncbi:MAG: elongation factor 1-beta [Asgard group archaeon]|nr:elongation factor 1-beta [Asgard group archaeon]